MKKKILSIIIILFALISVPFTLIAVAFAVPSQYDQSFYGGMKIKYDRLYGIRGKKAVMIGGSSTALGLRSDLLEKELGYSVVNYGLYANLGTKYMLDTAEDAIHEGDIVIIAPEQNNQSLSNYFNGEAVWYSADGNFDVLSKIPFDNIENLVSGFLPFVSGKFKAFSSGVKPQPDGVYNVHSFNSFGDICYDKREYNEMSEGYDVSTPISFSHDVIDDDFIDYINTYAKKLQDRGATVFFSFCPMNGSALESGTTKEKITDYYNYLREKLDFDVLGNPESRIMESGWFYDSNFHLNASGAIYYTRRLALDIKAATEDFTPVTIEIPNMPLIPNNPDGESGVSAEFAKAAELFNLTLHSAYNGKRVWRIDGLTTNGAALSEIEIPDMIAGIPVTEIGANVFAGNTNIKKITFGVNVNTVETGAFRGCYSLEGIYITSYDPDSYHPAKDVLDGADNCSFYLPEEVYASKYLPNYFWGAMDRERLKSY